MMSFRRFIGYSGGVLENGEAVIIFQQVIRIHSD